MRTIIFAILFVFSLNLTKAQYSIRASMGIDFASTPSLTDYINQNFPVGDSPLNDFNTAIIFSGECGFLIAPEFQLGVELGYLINSYNSSNELGKFDLDYNIISPSILGYYISQGNGYNIKFGGGLGLRLSNLDLSLPGTTEVTSYSSTGFGLILRAEGNTLLGGNFYANIGADLKYDMNGISKSDSKNLYNNISRGDVQLNSLSVGLRLGISYIF